MRILLADNHDSFTRNLEHLLTAATGRPPEILPVDRLPDVATCWPDGYGRAPWRLLVISPGPGAPGEYPQYAPFLGGEATRARRSHEADGAVEGGTVSASHPDGSGGCAPPRPCLVPTPVLGICLGLQVINAHFGGVAAPLPDCTHGKPDTVVYAGQARTVARYHSLHLSVMGAGMRVLARNGQGVVMAARHETLPLLGYQFHPESFLTPDGVWWIRHALHALGLR